MSRLLPALEGIDPRRIKHVMFDVEPGKHPPKDQLAAGEYNLRCAAERGLVEPIEYKTVRFASHDNPAADSYCLVAVGAPVS